MLTPEATRDCRMRPAGIWHILAPCSDEAARGAQCRRPLQTNSRVATDVDGASATWVEASATHVFIVVGLRGLFFCLFELAFRGVRIPGFRSDLSDQETAEREAFCLSPGAEGRRALLGFRGSSGLRDPRDLRLAGRKGPSGPEPSGPDYYVSIMYKL